MAKSHCVALLGLVLLASSALGQQTLPGVGTDGQLDQCQVILGSYAQGDGTFDKDSSFQATITDGVWSVPLSSILNNTGDVLYVVPAARSANYAPLTAADRDQAGYCNDIQTLLPVYNPQAVIIPDETNSSVVVSPISTLLAFGWAYGLREQNMHRALGFDDDYLVSSSYDGAAEFASDPNSEGALFYKTGVKLQNTVTLGATMLSNSTDSYASFAVLMDQALGRAAVNASSTYANRHSNATGPQLDLNNAATLEYTIYNAGQFVHASKDWLLPTQLNQLDSTLYAAAGLALANLADATDEAATPQDAAKAQYYAESTVAPQVDELVTGSISVEEFITVTSPSSISQGIAATVLPSAVASPSGAGSRSFGSSNTQAADSSSSDSGLSGGAIAGIVIGCIAGVALIALAALLVTKRRDAGRADTTPTESGPRRLWGRRQHDTISPNSAV